MGNKFEEKLALLREEFATLPQQDKKDIIAVLQFEKIGPYLEDELKAGLRAIFGLDEAIIQRAFELSTNPNTTAEDIEAFMNLLPPVQGNVKG